MAKGTAATASITSSSQIGDPAVMNSAQMIRPVKAPARFPFLVAPDVPAPRAPWGKKVRSWGMPGQETGLTPGQLGFAGPSWSRAVAHT